MVATKQGNMKRRMPARQNNGRFKSSSAGMNGLNKQFNNRINMNPMFNASQIPDNPGYVDFNEPTPPPPIQPVPIKMNHKQPMSSKGRYPRRMNQSNMKSQRNQNNSNGWGPNHGPPMVNPHHMGMPSHPGQHGRNFRGRPLPPPMGMRPPMPPPPPLPNMNGRFGPRPLIPPPMGMQPINPAMGPLRIGGPILPRPMLTRSGGSINSMNGGPIRRNKGNQNNRKNINKNRKRAGNVGSNTKGKKSTTTKKTLNEIVNQYPLDKPWVTDDIRDEQKKKEDIENRLKGNKNDKLFAEFKVQRDKFVKMYEAARLEYIGKHPEKDIEKIMTEPGKGGLIAKVKTEKSAAT